MPAFRFKETRKSEPNGWEVGNDLTVRRDPDGSVFVEIDYGNARFVSVLVTPDKVPALLAALAGY